MVDAAIDTATSFDAVSIATNEDENNNNGYLYLLDLDCPFAWPVEPNYPISRPQLKKGMMNGALNDSAGSHMDVNVHGSTVEAGPVPSTSRLPIDASLLSGQGEQANGTQQDMQLDQSNAANGHDTWPDSLQEYYWDCLYCSEGSVKHNEAPRRLVKAFKSEHYRLSSLQVDGTEEEPLEKIQANYRESLASLLYTKLGKLDKKYHVDLPAIINEWTRHHELLENGQSDIQDTSKQARLDEASKIAEKARTVYDEKELECLKTAWNGWMQAARDENGERVLNQEEKQGRMKSTIRDRLAALETAELQLQILIALELLSILPVPSYLTARSAHHRRLHSASSSLHSQNWLAILRNGTPQRPKHDTRKRKKEDNSSSASQVPGTPSSRLNPNFNHSHTTPRQNSLHVVQTLTPGGFIETIPEDGDGTSDLAVMERQRLERLFKDTARLLDAQTDNMAIQQTVVNALGGLESSLADLMGDIAGLDNNKGKSKEEEVEMDSFQSFWLDIVEEFYSERLPSDILSGCHSKFFSNSLDPSFAQTATSSSLHPQPSPFHHPTPNLKQLARSVQMANLQAEKNAVPQSPTLVKLLAAKDEKVNSTFEDGNDNFVGKEDVGWLMPAPAPAEPKLAPRQRRLAIEQEQSLVPPLKKGLKRSASSSSSSVFANHRQVEFGKAKEMKDKRAEIALMRTGKGANALRPFANSVSLVNAHQQSGSISTMASSLGAKNLNTISVPLKAGTTIGTGADLQTQDAPTNPQNLMQSQARISKRKMASPKKTTDLNRADGVRAKGRTLVLATPVKIRKKATFQPAQDASTQSTSVEGLSNRTLGKTKSLPAFAWTDFSIEKEENGHDQYVSDENVDSVPGTGTLLVGATPKGS